jgi:hypothetical protein
MSQETALDLEQSRQESPDAAVEIDAPSGAVAAGPDNPGRAHADAQVAEGEPAGEGDLHSTTSPTAPDPSESDEPNPETESRSAQVGDSADTLAETEPGQGTSRRDAAPGLAAAPSTSAGPASTAPASPALDARQVGVARRFGLAEEDLVVLEALGRTGRGFLERLAKADSDLSRRYSRLGRVEQAAGGAGTVVAARTRQTTAPTAVAPTTTAPAPEVAPEVAEELARLRGQVSQLLRQTQESQAARESADAERFFGQLDPQVYPDIAGGSTEKLPADAPQRKGRAALLVKAREIRSGHQAVGGGTMEVEESLGQALAVVAPGAAAGAERKRLARQLRLREAGFIARPTQRGNGAALESSADRTARALEDWQSRRGVRFFED